MKITSLKQFKKTPIFFFIFFLSSCGSSTLSPLYKIQKNELYGFIDTLGREIIKPQYLYVSDFSENLAVVIVDTTLYIKEIKNDTTGIISKYTECTFKYGYINKLGQFVIPPSFIGVEDNTSMEVVPDKFCFHSGLALYINPENELIGYINRKGNIVIPCQYKNGQYFSENKAIVQDLESSLWGCIDIHGDTIIDFQYNSILPYRRNRTIAYCFSLDTATYHAKNVVGINNQRILTDGVTDINGIELLTPILLDERGKIVGTPLSNAYWYMGFSDDDICLAVSKPEALLFGYGCHFIDKQGNMLKPLNIDRLTEMQIDSLNAIPSIQGILDDNFLIYEATPFENGYAGVMHNDKWHFIDRHFIVHGIKAYDKVCTFSKEGKLSAVKNNGKWGFINTNFEEAIPYQYDSCCSFEGPLAKAYINSNGLNIQLYIDQHGNTVWQDINTYCENTK